MAIVVGRRWLRGALSLLLATQASQAWAANPSAQDALKLTPVQKDVDFDRPTEPDKATIKAEQLNGKTGWVVREQGGNVLRQFLDTNNDNVVDQWCYYSVGIEVYRDIDSNYDGKADQYRWLNMSGTRWGIDSDQDGRIDEWKAISAEEVTAEVVRAIGERDAARFNRLLITSAEITALGLSEANKTSLVAVTQEAPTLFRTYLTSEKSPGAKFVSAGNKLKWVDFGGTLPGNVPAGTGGSTKDIVAYFNVLAMVKSGEDHDQIPIGTLIKVDNGWRLLDAPGEDNQVTKIAAIFPVAGLQNERVTKPIGGSGGTSEDEQKIQELVKKTEDFDLKIAKAAPADLPKLHADRADIVEQLAEITTGENRTIWYRQLADTVGVAAQSNAYPEGVTRLKALAEKLAKTEPDLVPYVVFRYLTADYYSKIQKDGADFAKVQTEWLESLKKFVGDYPKSSDAAEALLQLGIAEEFAGDEKAAKTWYTQAAALGNDLAPAKKAAGALTRIDSVGRVLNLSGKTLDGKPATIAGLKGKVVVLHYWASWCQPFIADMAALREVQAKYAREVVLLGANLDDNSATAEAFLKQNRLPWSHLWEQGGLDSNLANGLGIVTVPTVILIDKTGKVVNRNIHVTQLDKEIGALAK